jgi:hypothetical protein
MTDGMPRLLMAINLTQVGRLEVPLLQGRWGPSGRCL